MMKRIPCRSGTPGWLFPGLFPGLLVGFILVGCAGTGSYNAQPQLNRASCSFYKVGEVRGYTRSEVQAAMRRYGGDFVRSLPDQPGGNPSGITTYSAEIFRYEDPSCRTRR